MILLLLAAFVAAPTILQILFSIGPADRSPVAAGLLQALLLVTPPLVLILGAVLRVRQLGLDLENLGLSGDQIGRHMKSGVLYGLLLVAVNLVATQMTLDLLERLVGESVRHQAEAEQFGVLQLFGPEPSTLLIVYVAFAIVVLTPIAEEVFFRGYAYAVLRGRLGVRAGLIASAVLFALVHLYLVHLVPVLLLGWLLGWMYERTGSLVVPIVAHAVGNGAAVLTMLAYLARTQ